MCRKSKLLAPVSELRCWYDKLYKVGIINYLFTRGHNLEADCIIQTLLSQWSSILAVYLNHLDDGWVLYIEILIELVVHGPQHGNSFLRFD